MNPDSLFIDCYSTVADILCQKENVGSELDEIFYRGECRSIQSICVENGLSGVNVNFCFNQTANLEVSINDVITRTLSAEEFF
jgi:hypothetical protein